MSFEVVLSDSSIFDLSAVASAVQLQDRQRDYAISHGRAVEGPNWEVFGDGLEQPSQIKATLYLKSGLSRARQRDLIEQIDAAVTSARVFRNLSDLRETAVESGRITLESPTEDSYRLELTFWPTLRKSAFLEGFPLGRLRVLASADGRSIVSALDGYQIAAGTYAYTVLGRTFEFDTITAPESR